MHEAPSPGLVHTSVANHDHGQTNHDHGRNLGHDQTNLDPCAGLHIQALNNQHNNQHHVRSSVQLPEVLFYLHLAFKSPPYDY
jgi:hypothetical protein